MEYLKTWSLKGMLEQKTPRVLFPKNKYIKCIYFLNKTLFFLKLDDDTRRLKLNSCYI